MAFRIRDQGDAREDGVRIDLPSLGWRHPVTKHSGI